MRSLMFVRSWTIILWWKSTLNLRKWPRKKVFFLRSSCEKIADHGTMQDMPEIPADIRRLFVTAHDITPEDHIRIQAAFQKYTDNAVSKTVNFPRQATVEDVRKVFELAYQLGCKGVTIYRDGSRDQQVLSTGKKQEKVQESPVPEKKVGS